MAPEVYERVQNQLLPHAEEVHLHGLGEPTLSPQFDRMVDDAIRLNISIDFVTNTFKLTPERIERLARAGAHITVSVDGATAETHEWSRTAKNKFSDVMAALEQLREAKARHRDCNMTIHFSTVLTKRNVHDAPAILRLAGRFGASSIRYIMPGLGDRTDEYAQENLDRAPHLWEEVAPELRKAIKETGVEVFMPPYLEHLIADGMEDEHVLDSDANESTRTSQFHGSGGEPSGARAVQGIECSAGSLVKNIAQEVKHDRASNGAASGENGRIFPNKCRAPFHEIFIDVDGWVRPCCVMLSMGMGNILQDDLMTIWNNKHYRKLRSSINSNNPPEFCRRCNFAEGITGGDERFLEKYYAAGNPKLPEGPKIGYYWSKEEKKLYEYE